MNLRFTLASRTFVIPALAVAATVAIAFIGDSFTWARFLGNPAATPGTPVDDAKAKTKHTPVTALRSRMLEQFHGQATDAFTAIPGFGMERMIPMYKRVPFTIPDFSTSEVEVEKEIATPKALDDVFTKSLAEFRSPSKPAPAKKKDNFFGNPSPVSGFGGHASNTITRGLQLRMLDLVALIDPDHRTVYAGGKAFEIQRMTAEEMKASREKSAKGGFPVLPARISDVADAAKEIDGHGKAGDAKLATRHLDFFETMGVVELSQGKDLFIRHKDAVIRMLGALRATEQCLQCHTDHRKGDLLGAFSYTFVDTDKSLAKAATGNSAK